MPNDCNRTVNAGNGWQVTLVAPATNTPSTTFQYELTRVEGVTSREMSNVRICLCPGISDDDREDLLVSCSYTVFFDDESRVSCSGPNEGCCFIDNQIPNPNSNPAACKGLKFDNIPSGTGGAEQQSIFLNFIFTRPLPIGPVSIGLKAGNISAVATEVCGPVCDSIIPPTRGIIL